MTQRKDACLYAGVLVASLSCYSYASVDVDSVAIGETVRARLSTDGQEFLPALQEGTPGILEGRLIENRREGVLLVVPSMTTQVGFRFETMNQRLLIPHEHLMTLDKRRLDKTKTIALLGIAGVATGITLGQLLSGTSGSSVRPGGPDGISARQTIPGSWCWVP